MNRWFVFLFLLVSVGPAFAQESGLAHDATPSDSAKAYLLTMLPGDQVYSKFGHSAILIADDSTGLEKTYNYGTFDFNQPYFVLRFLRGNIDYMLDTAPYGYEIAKYDFLRRPVISQELDLEPQTIRALYANLEENALQENRAYRYDFLFDNCSTRLLDQLNAALTETGFEELGYQPADSQQTFREHLQPYLADVSWLRFGINLGLGMPADRAATQVEESFLPTALMDLLDLAQTGAVPLVRKTTTVLPIPEYAEPERTTDWPLIVFSLLFVLGAVLTARTWQKSSLPSFLRTFDAVLFAVVGVAGGILAFLWFGTQHEVTGPNLNLLWAWPTHLLAAWWIRKATLPGWMHSYLRISAVVGVFALVAWAFLPQQLPIPALPLVLLFVVRMFARSKPIPTS